MPGKYMSSAAKEKILSVLRYFKEKGEPKGVSVQKTMVATGVSRATIYRIEEEQRRHGKLTSPSRKKRGSYKPIDVFDEDVIRNKIIQFYSIRRQFPTLKALHTTLRTEINYPGCRILLYKTLKKMGFSFKKVGNNRKQLVEKPDILKQRLMFYERKKDLEDRGFQMVYTDETWIDTSYTKKSCWQGPGVEGINAPLNKGQRIIVVHAGSRAGFIQGAKLVYKAASSTGDYHGEMDGETFTKWIQEKLIPNLTVKSAIVMDNASYHSVHKDKSPTTATKKADIMEWLRRHGVQFNEGATRKQLLEQARMHKPPPSFTIDAIIRSHGHEVLRIPPYHPDFNAIEFIWSQLKALVSERNVTFRYDDLLRITDESFDNIGADRWDRACSKVEKMIEEMKRADNYSGERPPKVIINITGSDPEDTDTADEYPTDTSATDTADEM